MTTHQHLGLFALMLGACASVACGVDNQGLRSVDEPICKPQPVYIYVYVDHADGGVAGWVKRKPDGTRLSQDELDTINTSTNSGCLTPAGNAIPRGDGGP